MNTEKYYRPLRSRNLFSVEGDGSDWTIKYVQIGQCEETKIALEQALDLVNSLDLEVPSITHDNSLSLYEGRSGCRDYSIVVRPSVWYDVVPGTTLIRKCVGKTRKISLLHNSMLKKANEGIIVNPSVYWPLIQIYFSLESSTIEPIFKGYKSETVSLKGWKFEKITLDEGCEYFSDEASETDLKISFDCRLIIDRQNNTVLRAGNIIAKKNLSKELIKFLSMTDAEKIREKFQDYGILVSVNSENFFFLASPEAIVSSPDEDFFSWNVGEIPYYYFQGEIWKSGEEKIKTSSDIPSLSNFCSCLEEFLSIQLWIKTEDENLLVSVGGISEGEDWKQMK